MGNSFKENLKEILEYKDMTVKELAFLTGISNRSRRNNSRLAVRSGLFRIS